MSGKDISHKQLIRNYFERDPLGFDLDRDVSTLVRKMKKSGKLQKEPYNLSPELDYESFEKALIVLVRKNLYRNGDIEMDSDEQFGRDATESEKLELFSQKDHDSEALNGMMMVFTYGWLSHQRDELTPEYEKYETNPNTDYSRGGEEGNSKRREEEKEEVRDSYRQQGGEGIKWVFGKIGGVWGSFVDAIFAPVETLVYTLPYLGPALTAGSLGLGLWNQPWGGRMKTAFRMTALHVGNHILSMHIESLDLSVETEETLALGASVFGTAVQNQRSMTSLVSLVRPGAPLHEKIQSMIQIMQNWVFKPALGQSSFYSSYSKEGLFHHSAEKPNIMMGLILSVWDEQMYGRNSREFIREGGFEAFAFYMLDSYGHMDITDPAWSEHADFKKQGGLKLRNLFLPREDQQYLADLDESNVPIIIKKILDGGQEAYYTSSMSGIARFGIKDDTGLPAAAKAVKKLGDAFHFLPSDSPTIRNLMRDLDSVIKLVSPPASSNALVPIPPPQPPEQEESAASVVELSHASEGIFNRLKPSTMMLTLDPAFDELTPPVEGAVIEHQKEADEFQKKMDQMYQKNIVDAKKKEEERRGKKEERRKKREEENKAPPEQEEPEAGEEEYNGANNILKDKIKEVGRALIKTHEKEFLKSYNTIVDVAETYYNVGQKIIRETSTSFASTISSSSTALANYVYESAKYQVDNSILTEESLNYYTNPEITTPFVKALVTWSALAAKDNAYNTAASISNLNLEDLKLAGEKISNSLPYKYMVPGAAMLDNEQRTVDRRIDLDKLVVKAFNSLPALPYEYIVPGGVMVNNEQRSLDHRIDPDKMLEKAFNYFSKELPKVGENAAELIANVNTYIAENSVEPKASRVETEEMISKVVAAGTNMYTRMIKSLVFEKRLASEKQKSLSKLQKVQSLIHQKHQKPNHVVIDDPIRPPQPLPQGHELVATDSNALVVAHHWVKFEPPKPIIVEPPPQGSDLVASDSNAMVVADHWNQVEPAEYKIVPMNDDEEEKEEVKEEVPKEEEEEEEEEETGKKQKQTVEPWIDWDKALKLHNDSTQYERTRLFSLRSFFPVAGDDDMFDEQETEESDKLKESNLMMGMTPHHPLGQLDNPLWVGNQAREGLLQLGPLNTMPTYYKGGSLTEGDTLFGTQRRELPSS